MKARQARPGWTGQDKAVPDLARTGAARHGRQGDGGAGLDRIRRFNARLRLGWARQGRHGMAWPHAAWPDEVRPCLGKAGMGRLGVTGRGWASLDQLRLRQGRQGGARRALHMASHGRASLGLTGTAGSLRQRWTRRCYDMAGHRKAGTTRPGGACSSAVMQDMTRQGAPRQAGPDMACRSLSRRGTPRLGRHGRSGGTRHRRTPAGQGRGKAGSVSLGRARSTGLGRDWRSAVPPDRAWRRHGRRGQARLGSIRRGYVGVRPGSTRQAWRESARLVSIALPWHGATRYGEAGKSRRDRTWRADARLGLTLRGGSRRRQGRPGEAGRYELDAIWQDVAGPGLIWHGRNDGARITPRPVTAG